MAGAALLQTPDGPEVGAVWWSKLLISRNNECCRPIAFPTRNELSSLTASDPVQLSNRKTVLNATNTAMATGVGFLFVSVPQPILQILTRPPSNVNTISPFNRFNPRLNCPPCVRRALEVLSTVSILADRPSFPAAYCLRFICAGPNTAISNERRH